MKGNRFDAIIIGSGVGGLVCGNYLAKAGFRTLILEQHYFVGGCCSFYRRHGFVFDVGVHYLGNLRDGGFMRRVFEELRLFDILQIERISPSDVIIFPDRQIYFWSDRQQTLAALQEQFPQEAKALKQFFELLLEENLLVLSAKVRGRTFGQLLEMYFKDSKVKAVFCALLGNMGLPSAYLAGITGAILFRDYVLDGGYYPVGGAHQFTEALRQNFEQLGGTLLLRRSVKRICVERNRVRGVLLDDGSFFEAAHVVSNADARQTFLKLLGTEQTPPSILRVLNQMVPSVSAFIVYLGLRRSKPPLGNCPNVWYCKTYSVDRVYEQTFLEQKINLDDFLFCSFPGVHDLSIAPAGFESAHVLVLAPTKNAAYWRRYRNEYAERLINLAQEVRPHLAEDVVFKEPATPLTIERYTRNLGGSIYGWASTSEQVGNGDIPQRLSIEGLYLAGHWTTKPTGQGGVTMATYAGRHASQLIQKRLKRRKVFTAAVSVGSTVDLSQPHKNHRREGARVRSMASTR